MKLFHDTEAQTSKKKAKGVIAPLDALSAD